MFLVPLDTPGITVHPVHTLSDERTNVTYYSGVRIPDRYRVGEVGGGWNVVGYALEIEHGAAGGSAGHGSHLRELAERASRWARSAVRDGKPVLADARARERLARVQMHADMSFVLDRRALWLGATGRPDRGEGPMSKIFGTDVCSDGRCRSARPVGARLAAAQGQQTAPSRRAIPSSPIGSPRRRAIYAGTSEIMRSIIAQLALGLPRSRS